MVSSEGKVESTNVAWRPQLSPAWAMTGSILPLMRMHRYPDPLNGFSGNQWSRYLLRRTSTRARRNFSNWASLMFLLPNLMRWIRKLAADWSSNFIIRLMTFHRDKGGKRLLKRDEYGGRIQLEVAIQPKTTWTSRSHCKSRLLSR